MLNFSQDEIIYWSGFLDKYHELKCLWSKSKLYADKDQYRIERQSAYLELLKYCRIKYPKADVNFVTQKLQYFGSLFNKSYKKVLKCREQGVTFIPNLWYYKKMLFLIEDESNKADNQTNLPILATRTEQRLATKEPPPLENAEQSVDPTLLNEIEIKIERIDDNEFDSCNGLEDDSNVASINSVNNQYSIDNVAEHSDTNLLNGTEISNDYLNSDLPSNIGINAHSDSRQSIQRKSTKRRRKNSSIDYLTMTALKEVQKLSKEDEFDIAGRKLSFDLREMSKEQRLLTEKIISEVVYNGKCNLLKCSYIFKPSSNDSSGTADLDQISSNLFT